MTTDTALAETYLAAMKIWDAQKADGVSLTDRLAGLEKTLRLAWPQIREWKYLCEACGDIGLRVEECRVEAVCGRSRPHLAHSYGVPCWCTAGAKFRDKAKPNPEDFQAAGKSTKRRTWTRAGR